MHIRKKHLAYLLITFVLIAGTTSWASESVSEVSRLKAAMVYNMAKYVDWPQEAFTRDDGPLTICSAGRGSMIAAIESLQDKLIKGHPVVVHQVSGKGEIRFCHILVIGDMDLGQLRTFINKTVHHSILTVSDRNRFTRYGGIVGFYPQDNKLRFEINNEKAQEHNLRISSQLLKLARIVRENDP